MAKRKSAELGERRVLVKGMAHSQSRIVERGKDGNEKTQGHDGTSGGMGLWAVVVPIMVTGAEDCLEKGWQMGQMGGE